MLTTDSCEVVPGTPLIFLKLVLMSYLNKESLLKINKLSLLSPNPVVSSPSEGEVSTQLLPTQKLELVTAAVRGWVSIKLLSVCTSET